MLDMHINIIAILEGLCLAIGINLTESSHLLSFHAACILLFQCHAACQNFQPTGPHITTYM